MASSEARRGEARRSAHGGERGHDGCDCTGVQERLEEEARAPEGGGRGTGRHGRAGRRRSQGRRIGGEEVGGIAGIAGGSQGAARLIGRIEYLVWQSHCGRGNDQSFFLPIVLFSSREEIGKTVLVSCTRPLILTSWSFFVTRR